MLQARLLEARGRHPTWGPRELLALMRRQGRRQGIGFAWPAWSTVAELLRRNGLSVPRRRQQERCELFREEYNAVRPHEAMADATPSSRYTRSPRLYPSTLPPVEYPPHFEVRLVSAVGFEEIDEVEWDRYVARMKHGRFHEPLRRIEEGQGRLARNRGGGGVQSAA